MPFRAEAPFLPKEREEERLKAKDGINALSGWDSISTEDAEEQMETLSAVSMPFRAETPFLPQELYELIVKHNPGINALSGWGSFSTK